MQSESITPWIGTLDLKFAYMQGQTRLIHVQTQAPLKVQQPHYPEGSDVCYTTILHTAGGLVSGDQLHQVIELQPQSRVLITTPAATKVYPSTGATAVQTTHIQVAPQSHLEWLPQETIVFQKALYQQHLHIDLHPGATALVWDLTRLGRTARGEPFLQGSWRSRTEIWQAGRPLWIDPQIVNGDPVVWQSPQGLNGYPVVASLVWVGQAIDLSLLRDEVVATGVPSEWIGITRHLQGFVCRYRGASLSLARQCFVVIWRYLRLSQYGTIPSIPRIWGSF